MSLPLIHFFLLYSLIYRVSVYTKKHAVKSPACFYYITCFSGSDTSERRTHMTVPGAIHIFFKEHPAIFRNFCPLRSSV